MSTLLGLCQLDVPSIAAAVAAINVSTKSIFFNPFEGIAMRYMVSALSFAAATACGQAALGQFPCSFTYTSPNDLNAGASVVVDINGDGIRDIVSHRPAGMVCLLGSDYGSYAAVFSAGQATATVPGGLVVADFNGDGKPDSARSSYENNNPSLARVVVAFGNGAGGFANEIQLLAGNWAIEVEAADIDGDGDVDLICGTELNGIQVWKNNGDGTFGARASFGSGSINRQMALVDVSGDGRPDVVLNNETSNQLSVLINSGTGTFPTRVTYATGSYPTGLAVADFDNDGDLDVAVAHRNTLEVRLFRNFGNGALTTWQTISNPVGSAMGVLLANDFDGDGDSDLCVVSGYGGTAKWRVYTNSAGSFSGGAQQTSNATGWWAVTGLVDADTKPDVVICENYTGVASVTYRGLTTTCGQPTCVDADIFRDFNVNGADLSILLSQWGANTPLTESDLNSDGVVNGADLGILLSFWGDCPSQR
jgi:hypothetical protein